MRYCIMLLGAVFVMMPYVAFSQERPSYAPTGIFSSHIGHEVERYINEPFVKGALVRVRWSEIESREGVYDFSAIDEQLYAVKKARKKWSLAVIAGANVPRWMNEKIPEKMQIAFRGQKKTIIPFWNRDYQLAAIKLAKALADRYGKDSSLVLVYVPQQTANGIEGHFNGTSEEQLKDQGLTATRWLWAAKTSIDGFVRAFPRKAVAIELHEIFRGAPIVTQLMATIVREYRGQVGVGVWWLSGKERYQSALLHQLRKRKLPVYAQVIGKSSQPHRFADGDYGRVFQQAKEINAAYIEVWNYELEREVSPEVTRAIHGFSRLY